MNIKSLFPNTNEYDKIQYDEEGLYSITHPNDALIITDIILLHSNNNCSIVDCTGGLGGNTLSFCKKFEVLNSL